MSLDSVYPRHRRLLRSLPHAERPEGNNTARNVSGGCYHYLRASTPVTEPEIRDVIIVSAHFELCSIKYPNLKHERKIPHPKKTLKSH